MGALSNMIYCNLNTLCLLLFFSHLTQGLLLLVKVTPRMSRKVVLPEFVEDLPNILEIVEMEPMVSEVQERWPALFCEAEVSS